MSKNDLQITELNLKFSKKQIYKPDTKFRNITKFDVKFEKFPQNYQVSDKISIIYLRFLNLTQEIWRIHY